MRPDPDFGATPSVTAAVGLPIVATSRVDRRRAWIVVGVSGAVLGADAGSKLWALGQPANPAASTALVQVWHVTNTGAGFGLGAHHPIAVLGLALVTTAVVVWWLVKATAPVERVAVAVLLGGAFGNLLDRVVNGAVTDWVHIGWYPATFNLADVAIRGGVLVAVTAHALSRRRAGDPCHPLSSARI
jgi:signal peptidase II